MYMDKTLKNKYKKEDTMSRTKNRIDLQNGDKFMGEKTRVIIIMVKNLYLFDSIYIPIVIFTNTFNHKKEVRTIDDFKKNFIRMGL